MAPFDGYTYRPDRDRARLGGQLARVLTFLMASGWVTLAQIAEAAGCSQPSASARLRDLRKVKFGSYTVTHRNLGGGRWVYRLDE